METPAESSHLLDQLHVVQKQQRVFQSAAGLVPAAPRDFRWLELELEGDLYDLWRKHTRGLHQDLVS